MPARQLDPLDNTALRDRVVAAIRDAIVRGSLRPGEKVPEDDLAQQLGVSRTPVREAIRILEIQGLVKVRPKRGTYIATVNPADEADGLAVRSSLEELAVRQALQRSTEGSWRRLCGELEALLPPMNDALEANDLVRAVELDISFHTTIVEGSRNRYLTRTWRLVGIPSLVWSPEREGYASPRPEWTAGLLAKHDELVQAMRTRDEERCVQAVREHIARKVAEIGVMAT